MKRTIYIFIAVFVFVNLLSISCAESGEKLPAVRDVNVGTTKEYLFKYYQKTQERTYRIEGSQEWITFNYPTNRNPYCMITFHLNEGGIVGWKLNDRNEVVKEYLSEFCSQAFMQTDSKIYIAIYNVLKKLPDDAFFLVTDRERPVIFTEFYTSGTARFATSSEIRFLEGDPPTFTDGLWIIKLSEALNKADSTEAIEGIVAHELAHRVLGHGNTAVYSKSMERQANNLVKKWGFEKAFLKARAQFGMHTVHKPEELNLNQNLNQ